MFTILPMLLIAIPRVLYRHRLLSLIAQLLLK
ncbi:hypothetical protein LL50_05360 [Listeria monocytogenes]|nr:hypothetical protein [Listeria monocytogenes]EAD0383116.1 hypothetical protein [Listeria monocytogenes]